MPAAVLYASSRKPGTKGERHACEQWGRAVVMAKSKARAARDANAARIEAVCTDLPAARWESGRALVPQRRKVGTMDEVARSRPRNIEATPMRRVVHGEAIGPTRDLARILAPGAEGRQAKGRAPARSVVIVDQAAPRGPERVRGLVSLEARGQAVERRRRPVEEPKHDRPYVGTYGEVCDRATRAVIAARNVARQAEQHAVTVADGVGVPV